MNRICNQFKSLLNFNQIQIQFTKNCTQYINYPKKWERPKEIAHVEPEKSGDGGIDFKIKETDFIVNYEKSKLLENADEMVKKIFSVQFHRRKDLAALQFKKTIQSVNRHENDIGSMEAKIAAATVEILRLQEHYSKLPRDKVGKVFLKELIEKRKKWLRKLRDLDYPRFEFLLDRLNLVYHPFPEENYRLYTGFCKKLLHKQRCDQKMQMKMDAYKAELESKKKNFFKMKVERLKYIRATEIECGVEPTISEKEIEKAKAKAALYL